MMSKTDYDFSGLDEMEKTLSQMIEHDYPEEFKKMVKEIAFELEGKVLDRTPVKTGYLRNQWHVGSIVKRGNDGSTNNQFYVALRDSFRVLQNQFVGSDRIFLVLCRIHMLDIHQIQIEIRQDLLNFFKRSVRR